MAHTRAFDLCPDLFLPEVYFSLPDLAQWTIRELVTIGQIGLTIRIGLHFTIIQHGESAISNTFLKSIHSEGK